MSTQSRVATNGSVGRSPHRPVEPSTTPTRIAIPLLFAAFGLSLIAASCIFLSGCAMGGVVDVESTDGATDSADVPCAHAGDACALDDGGTGECQWLPAGFAILECR